MVKISSVTHMVDGNTVASNLSFIHLFILLSWIREMVHFTKGLRSDSHLGLMLINHRVSCTFTFTHSFTHTVQPIFRKWD